MEAAGILAIIKYIQLAIAAAPEVEKAVIKAKDFITALFSAKLITADQQSALHSHIDDLAETVLDGQGLPESWTVDPDPS